MTATMQAPPTPRSSREQLLFLDGLRGLAALGVAVFHAFLFTGSTGQAPRDLPVLQPVFGLGQYGVTVFIALSGFVLALPVARTEGLVLRGGLVAFIRRRARRILPPYYAAVVLFTLLIVAIPGLNEPAGTVWDSKVPVDARAIATHLVLLQNLDSDSIYKIAGPMWSVATEWQIYFVFAFALIPLWRRFGAPVAAASGLLATIAVHLVAPRFDGAHLWFLGVFGFGVVAASLVARPPSHERAIRVVAWVGVGLPVLVTLGRFDWSRAHAWIVEPILGLGMSAGLVLLTWRARTDRAGRLVDVLSSRTMVKLGLFSYSVYLVHSPLIGWANLATRGLDLPTALQLLLLLVLAVPASVAISYGFFLLVERRFLNSHQRQVKA